MQRIQAFMLADSSKNTRRRKIQMTERNGLSDLMSRRSVFEGINKYIGPLEQPPSSSRKLWQDLDLLMRKTDDPATQSPNDVLQAEAFSKYFIEKVDGIRQGIQGVPEPDYALSDGGSFNPFTPTTVEETEHLIAAAPNKHCLLDPVPTALIKNCATLLAPFLSELFNRSLLKGYIPAS